MPKRWIATASTRKLATIMQKMQLPIRQSKGRYSAILLQAVLKKSFLSIVVSPFVVRLSLYFDTIIISHFRFFFKFQAFYKFFLLLFCKNFHLLLVNYIYYTFILKLFFSWHYNYVFSIQNFTSMHTIIFSCKT